LARLGLKLEGVAAMLDLEEGISYVNDRAQQAPEREKAPAGQTYGGSPIPVEH